MWTCPRCLEHLQASQERCEPCGRRPGEDPVLNALDARTVQSCPFCGAEARGPAPAGRRRCGSCVREFDSHGEWLRRCREAAFAEIRARLPRKIERVPDPPAGVGIAAGLLVAGSVLHAALGFAFVQAPLAALGVLLGFYGAAAGLALRAGRPGAEGQVRMSSALLALLPFSGLGVLFAGIHFYFARPWVLRAYGNELRPAEPDLHRGLLVALALVASVLAAGFLVLVPDALGAEAPSGWLWFAAELWRAHWVLPGLVLGTWCLACWGLSNRDAFQAAGVAMIMALVGAGLPSLLAAMRERREARFAEQLAAAKDPADWVRALGRSDVRSRRIAARSLAAGRRTSVTASALVDALRDADEGVRFEAALGVARFAPDTPGLADLVLSGPPKRESERVRALGLMGPWAKGALGFLSGALERQDEAGAALAELGVGAVPALTQALGRPEAAARRRACEGLRLLGPAARSAAEGLEGALKDADLGVRAAAARALGQVLRDKAVPVLLPLLGAEPEVAAAAADTLCALGRREGLAAARPDGNALNAIRSPQAWEHLARTPLESTAGGPAGEVLEELAVASITCVEVERAGPAGLDEVRRVHADGRRRSVLDALLALEVPFVLDGDRIRVMDRGEARRFWSAWLLEVRHPGK
jgi:HEAT repeat protein